MLYFGIGCSPTETVYAGSCHFVDFKMDPIKYGFENPALTGRVARGQMILIEYDIRYTSQEAIEGSVLSDYLAQQPIEDYQPMKFEFPDEDI